MHLPATVFFLVSSLVSFILSPYPAMAVNCTTTSGLTSCIVSNITASPIAATHLEGVHHVFSPRARYKGR